MENKNTTEEILARYALKRKERASRPTDQEANLQLASYLQSAAVLHTFNPETLQPLQQQFEHKQVRLLLFDHIVKTPGGLDENLFSLKLTERQKALKELGSKEAMAKALEANPHRIKTDLQILFEAYVQQGAMQAPAEMTYQQTALYCQLLSWLDGMDPHLLPLAEATILLKQKSVLAAFEHLVDKNFTGRQQELNLLREHIKSNTQASHSKPILSISGPGGIGKSALTACLLMENAFSPVDKRIPFAYLAFDQATFRIEAPFTILQEAATQLELQLPQSKEDFEYFRQQIRNFRDEQSGLKSRSVFEDSRQTRIERSQNINHSLYEEFGELLHSITPALAKTVLLVFDTFEEVEYRDKENLGEFWAMLATVQYFFPGLRIIIAGRTSIRNLHPNPDAIEERILERLNLSDSIVLLKNLGIEETIAQSIATQIGGNPLSLRLAANLVSTMKANNEVVDMNDITGDGLLLFELDEQLIQGQLYNRILDHIHDEDVQKLAHPGMILRVTSPLLILHVLAPVCQLNVTNLEQATDLFEKLKREHALVKMGPADTLIYRPEIREAMIRLLQQDKPEEVREIHRMAIEYYYSKDDIESRAEEVYHRLSLGDDNPSTLNDRWKEGIEFSVVQNLSEYSSPAKAWLASHMSLEVDRSVFEDVSTLEWEQNITRKVQRSLTRADAENALILLRERAERSEASPLFALEAKALLLQEKYTEAGEVLNRGIRSVGSSTNRGRLAELLWLRAQVALSENKPPEADDLLNRAEQALAKQANPVALMHILCHRLYITELYGQAAPAKIQLLRARLNQASKQLTYNYSYLDAFVIKMAKYYLQQEYPETYNRLDEFESDILAPSPGMLTSENLRGLDEFRGDMEKGDAFEAFESTV